MRTNDFFQYLSSRRGSRGKELERAPCFSIAVLYALGFAVFYGHAFPAFAYYQLFRKQHSLRKGAYPKAKVPLSTNKTAASLRQVTSLVLQTLNGQTTDIMKPQGWKVVTFWSPACPCVQSCQATSLIPLWQHYDNGSAVKGVRFYAVASNASSLEYLPKQEKIDVGGNEVEGDGKENRTEQVRLYQEGDPDQRPPYPLLLDRHHQVATILGAVSTPQVFLISPEGTVLFQGDPDDSARRRKTTSKAGVLHYYLSDALRQALAGKKILHPQAPTFGCTIDHDNT